MQGKPLKPNNTTNTNTNPDLNLGTSTFNFTLTPTPPFTVGTGPGKPVELIDPITGVVLRAFKSATDAGKVLDLGANQIGRVCNGHQAELKGRHFRWGKTQPPPIPTFKAQGSGKGKGKGVGKAKRKGKQPNQWTYRQPNQYTKQPNQWTKVCGWGVYC